MDMSYFFRAKSQQAADIIAARLRADITTGCINPNGATITVKHVTGDNKPFHIILRVEGLDDESSSLTDYFRKCYKDYHGWDITVGLT